MPAVEMAVRAAADRRVSALNTAANEDAALERPTIGQRVGYLISNPWKNCLLPACWLKRLLKKSPSPLLKESFARPGGWQSMEIIYKNDEPVDWFDRQALRDNPISMAARNRRRIITACLAKLIARYGAGGEVVILGVGGGPGRHVQQAIADAGIDSARVSAYLIDLDETAFDCGRALAHRLQIADSVHFRRGDARRIHACLPETSAQIVKLVGLVEYLSDAEFVELLRALRDIIPPGGSLVTHGLVDAYGTGRFLARAFNLRHKCRTGSQMIDLLDSAGFRPVDCVLEPVGVYPIITAVHGR